jgi:ribosomal protein S18 acetylase RimI-like enzyme
MGLNQDLSSRELLSKNNIRRMLPSDVSTVTKVHIKSFSGFFLTSLGSAFLRNLYSSILDDPDGIGYVAIRHAQIVGFAAGTAQPSGFYRRLLVRRWWQFAWSALPAVLRQPTIIPRLLRAFSLPAQVTHAKRGTLMSIAILPECQGNGIGQSLVTAFLEEASQRGLYQVDLTTDRDHNQAANRFYQRLGFVCQRSFVRPEGRAMNEYVIDLH